MNTMQHDLYYDNPTQRSPRSAQNHAQTVRPQGSRGFEQYPHVPAGLFGPSDDQSLRFDQARYGERATSGMHTGFGGYDMGAAQAWNSAGYGHNTLNALNVTTRYRSSNRGRGAMPEAWFDQSHGFQQMTGYAGMPGMSMNHARQEPNNDEEALIPTAIVIKNIPFAVKKEQLIHVMTEMNLPLPYAFNYHFDNGVFRGLAFANFTTPEETAAVIDAMNHLDLQGRKLRVEYKKMLPEAERQRIDREKKEKRGQLEEQHRPMAGTQLQNQPSISSLSHLHGASPSPLQRSPDYGLDMNNPVILAYHTKLHIFKESTQESVSFPATMSPEERRLVHTLAHMYGLGHTSTGQGAQRQLHVFKLGSNGLSPILQTEINPLDDQRRSLNRAATTDFTNVKASDPSFYGTLNKQSSGFLGFSENQGGLSAGANLRAAKSFADLRSYTPSPAPSAASFPATLTGNPSRFAHYGQNSPVSTRPNATPTTTSMPTASESILVNGLGAIDLNNGFGTGGSPRRVRNMLSWDEQPGPIGSQRGFTGNYDESGRLRSQGAPLRQPRGPVPDRGAGFTRGRQNGHQTRGSDETSSATGLDLNTPSQ